MGLLRRSDAETAYNFFNLTDHLGIRQAEVVHELDEFVLGFGQTGVELLLLSHGGAGKACNMKTR